MQMYCASVEVNAPAMTRADDDWIDQLVDRLRPYHGVPYGSPRGYRGAAITIPAESIDQAAGLATALVRDMFNAEVIALEVMTEAEFNAREGFDDPIPDLLSVTEAAELLQLERQTVLHHISTGTLQADKVGSTYVLTRSSVEAAARRAGVLEAD